MEILDNLFILIEIGGPVMVPIFVVSAWLWILIALKSDWVWRSNRGRITLNEAVECLERDTMCPSGGPRATALNHFMATLRGADCKNVLADELLLDVAIRRQTGTIYRFIPTIIILAAVAPLLGLFGTVSGMVETFKVIGIYGMGNAQAMASGIRRR